MKKTQRLPVEGWLLRPLIAVLALLLVFEEWLWDTLKAQLHRISHLPLVHRAETALRQLPPWPSLLVLIIPGASLLPFKIAGIWALAHGHPLLGLGIFVLAKLTGTALAAYLFDLVRDRARELVWFDGLYSVIVRLLRRAHAWLDGQPTYRAARAKATQARQWILRDRGMSRRRSVWARRLNRAKLRVMKFLDR